MSDKRWAIDIGQRAVGNEGERNGHGLEARALTRGGSGGAVTLAKVAKGPGACSIELLASAINFGNRGEGDVRLTFALPVSSLGRFGLLKSLFPSWRYANGD